jgi:hypothetical protein
MDVEILHFEGCPNTAEALHRLQMVLKVAGVDAQVRLSEVHDAAEAISMRFLGSPTIRVNDEDIEPAARRRTDYGFMCRTYRGEDGAATGVPPAALIAGAVRSALKGR